MKLVIYSIVLNHHQAPLADELFRLLGNKFAFVELSGNNDNKGSTEDYTTRPYLIRAWINKENFTLSMQLALKAECCIFSGVQSLPFMKERLKLNLLSFDMGERWLKQGIKNLFSPTIFKMFLSYWIYKWYKKPLYKLCMSAFAATDHYRLRMYKNKCFKWGYFTKNETNESKYINHCFENGIKIMWCGRYLRLKHPETPIIMAQKLKSLGYKFHLDMYGEGKYKKAAQELVSKLKLNNEVSFFDNKPNNKLMADMREHHIFLFTSDKNEGWGAVANESMSNGCLLISSDTIGSAPYLIKNGETGLLFKSPKTKSSLNNIDKIAVNSLVETISWILNNPNEMEKIRCNAVQHIRKLWNPANAAQSLLILINNLKKGRINSLKEGPCSIA